MGGMRFLGGIDLGVARTAQRSAAPQQLKITAGAGLRIPGFRGKGFFGGVKLGLGASRLRMSGLSISCAGFTKNPPDIRYRKALYYPYKDLYIYIYFIYFFFLGGGLFLRKYILLGWLLNI